MLTFLEKYNLDNFSIPNLKFCHILEAVHFFFASKKDHKTTFIIFLQYQNLFCKKMYVLHDNIYSFIHSYCPLADGYYKKTF